MVLEDIHDKIDIHKIADPVIEQIEQNDGDRNGNKTRKHAEHRGQESLSLFLYEQVEQHEKNNSDNSSAKIELDPENHTGAKADNVSPYEVDVILSHESDAEIKD